jgi:hypothetical protein
MSKSFIPSREDLTKPIADPVFGKELYPEIKATTQKWLEDGTKISDRQVRRLEYVTDRVDHEANGGGFDWLKRRTSRASTRHLRSWRTRRHRSMAI